jgi:hypothetical protein
MWFLETRSRSARLHHPVFRSSTRSARGTEGAAIRSPTSAEETLLSPKQGCHPNRAPDPRGATSEKRPLDEAAVEEFVTVTPLDTLRGLDGATFVPMMQPANPCATRAPESRGSAVRPSLKE